eukprot:14088294-Ditylum_brightwellii.AAC.1
MLASGDDVAHVIEPSNEALQCNLFLRQGNSEGPCDEEPVDDSFELLKASFGVGRQYGVQGGPLPLLTGQGGLCPT